MNLIQYLHLTKFSLFKYLETWRTKMQLINENESKKKYEMEQKNKIF